MNSRPLLSLGLLLALSALACRAAAGGAAPAPTLAADPYQNNQTVFGFFPTPPEPTLDSLQVLYPELGQHADVVLLQTPIPWEAAADSDSGKAIQDMRGHYRMARQNGMDIICVIDPLNGLNRREFFQLPAGWTPSFADPVVRRAFTNFTLSVVKEFQPRYLGLASEINTYADAHPDDFPAYVSLYQEVYDQVKQLSPETQVFVTFQWDDLNNVIRGAEEGRQPFTVNWEQVEVFEPRLDVWVISSYPFGVFPSGAEIPPDYYTPLLTRTAKPLAVAEGGYTSRKVTIFSGTPQDQVDYLNALDRQVGERLAFWIYLLLNDINPETYAKLLEGEGLGKDAGTLGLFTSVGLRTASGEPKPALEVWDALRRRR